MLSNPARISRLLDVLWIDLQAYLSLLGSMVALVTLPSSALRQAIESAPTTVFPNSGRPPTQSTSLLVLYSLAWAAIVAGVWAPGFFATRALAVAAVEQMHPLPTSSASTNWPTVLEDRAKVADKLHASSTPIESLRAGLLVLAPLIGSLFGLLLPK